MNAQTVLTNPSFALTKLWSELFDPWNGSFVGEFVHSVRTIATGRTRPELIDGLHERGVDGLSETDSEPGLLASVVASLAGGNTQQFWNALHTIRHLGRGRPFQVASEIEDIYSVLQVFDAAGIVPRVVIRLRKDVRSLDRDQRDRVCTFFARLSEVCDVRLVCTNYLARWLSHTHEEQLPSVSLRRETPSLKPLLETAEETIGYDGPHVKVLQVLANAPRSRRTYPQLADEMNLGVSRIRQIVANSSDDRALVNLGLIRRIYPDGPTGVNELTEAGEEYVSLVSREIGIQESLDAVVRDSRNQRYDTPYTHADKHGEEDPLTEAAETAVSVGRRDRNRLSRVHEVRDLPRWEAFVGETAASGSIQVMNAAVEPQDDRGSAGWFYDYEDDRLVVSAEADNPMQYSVCLARALVSEKTLQYVLTEERLESKTCEQIVTWLDEHKETLRGSRCLGYLPDRVRTFDDYCEELREARDSLLDLTRKWARQDFSVSRAKFRSIVTREALGLAGTMAHILDLCGVDIVRVVRLPDYASRFPNERRDAVLQNLMKHLTIQSRYGQSVAQRHLFEDDDDLREQSITPTVDAANPFGQLIGSVCLLGDFGAGEKHDSFVTALKAHVRNPAQLHEDAPEFSIPIEVNETQRSTYAGLLRKVLATKGLEITRETVSLVAGLTASPYAAAEAFTHRLSDEESNRKIRASEVRFTLASLPPRQLLEGTGSDLVPRQLVATLLHADKPLSRSELVDRNAGSYGSLSTHLPRLIAMGLVSEIGEGQFRLELSFTTDGERHRDRLPSFVTSEPFARDVVSTMVDELCPMGSCNDDNELYALDGPIWSVWSDLGPEGVPVVDRLTDPLPWMGWVIPMLRALCGHPVPKAGEPRRVNYDSEVVSFGAPIKQTYLVCRDEKNSDSYLSST